MGETALVEVDFLVISSRPTEDLSGLEEQVLVVFELDDFFLEFEEAFGEFVKGEELGFDFLFDFVKETEGADFIGFEI